MPEGWEGTSPEAKRWASSPDVSSERRYLAAREAGRTEDSLLAGKEVGGGVVGHVGRVDVLMLTSCSSVNVAASSVEVAMAMRGRVPCCDACVTWQSPVNPGGGVVSCVVEVSMSGSCPKVSRHAGTAAQARR